MPVWQGPVCPSLHPVQGIESNLQSHKPPRTGIWGSEFQTSSRSSKYPCTQTWLQAYRTEHVRAPFGAKSKSKPSLRELAKSEHPLMQTAMKMLYLHWFFKRFILQLSEVLWFVQGAADWHAPHDDEFYELVVVWVFLWITYRAIEV